MQKRHKILGLIIVLVLAGIGILSYCLYLQTNNPLFVTANPNSGAISSTNTSVPNSLAPPPYSNTYETVFVDEKNKKHELKVLNSTFLHNPMRNYYGDSAPDALDIIWKHNLGTGTTQVGKETKTWKGAGWTGQPLMVIENGKKYLIQGAYDHHLKKIDAQTGKLVWQYLYDDVIKGTGSIWLNPNADSLKHACIILQGSRAGKSTFASYIPSYRAISYFTGEELWRLNSSKTWSYSRDVDGSALLLNDTAYLGLENGIFTIFNPNPDSATIRNKMLQPQIHKNTDTLYLKKDKKLHGGNLVTEASPTLLGNRVYIPSGSGHVWGYNLTTQQMDWDYYIGSDIDGSAVVTDDNCLLIAIEKQYINGRGGLLKLDPSQAPKDAAQWFFPTENHPFTLWEGGIIGSAAVNYHYKKANQPSIAAFTAIDGFFYVIDTRTTEPDYTTTTYDTTLSLPQPKLLFKYQTGPSISTPLIINNKIVVATYKGIYLFEFDDDMNFTLKAKNRIRCESTPFVDDHKIYVASRNGYLYCLGRADTTTTKPKVIQ